MVTVLSYSDLNMYKRLYKCPSVRPSVCQSPKPLSLSELLLSTSEPINQWAYQPSSLSTIEPINHQAYQPSSLLIIEPINHQAYQPLSPLTIEPIDLWSSFATFKPFPLVGWVLTLRAAFQPFQKYVTDIWSDRFNKSHRKSVTHWTSSAFINMDLKPRLDIFPLPISWWYGGVMCDPSDGDVTLHFLWPISWHHH